MQSSKRSAAQVSDALLRAPLAGMRQWSWRRWLVALGAAVAAALLTGVPTDIVPTGLFQRMTPVRWWDYPVWATSALLLGLIAATYVRAPSLRRERAGLAFGGGLIAFFAVGCPVCNKLVVAALGVGGALSYFGPIQPALAVVSVALLAVTLIVRLGGLAACRVRSSMPVAAASDGVRPALGDG